MKQCAQLGRLEAPVRWDDSILNIRRVEGVVELAISALRVLSVNICKSQLVSRGKSTRFTVVL
jgi:hypothetical protein